MSQTRDQIISFLLQQDDNKDRVIVDLQKQLTDAQKKLAESGLLKEQNG